MKDQIKRILDISHHLNWNSKPKVFTHYNFPVLCLNSKMYNGEIKIQGYPVSVSVSAQNGRNTMFPLTMAIILNILINSQLICLQQGFFL